MKLIPAVAMSGLLLSSCASYDYPRKQLKMAVGEKVEGFELRKVTRDSVTFIRAENRQGLYLLQGEEKSIGSNSRLKLLACHPKSNSADIEYSSLEYRGGLVLPPF